MPPLLYPTRYERPVPNRWRWPVAAVLALIAQAVVVGVMLVFSNLGMGAAQPTRPTRPVNLAGLSTEEWERNRTVTNGPTAPRVEERPPEKKETMPEGQVVATPRGNDEVPDESSYLAESNNRVEKETRSKHQTRLYKNPAARLSGPQAAPNGAATEGRRAGKPTGESEDKPAQGLAAKERALEIPSTQQRDPLDVRERDDGSGPGMVVAERKASEAVRGNSDRFRFQPGGAQRGADSGAIDPQGSNGRLILTPSAEVLDSIIGAPANDHLERVEEGEGTFLNTREWKYASFSNRVKQYISHNWDIETPGRLRDPTGQIYGSRDRFTLLKITLDDQGRLEELELVRSSGVDWLDEAALLAVRRAQPFPNPPAGMLDEDQKVRFDFGFTVHAARQARIQVFRRGY